MVAANFPECLKFVLKEEGQNDDDPNDHGGRTSRGIIQREWNSWRAKHPELNLPEDVWQAPQEQIEAIYEAQYWQPYCDRFPGGLDLEFFDFCVNAGRQQAVKTLQKALGVGVDGMMGIITWTAVENADQHALVAAYAENRRTFYRALAQFPRYGRGWLGRTDRCEVAATKLVTAAPPAHPAPVPSVKPSPKANPGDPKKPTVHPETGTGLSGILAMLAQFRDSIQNLTGIKHADYILLGIALVTFLISMYGFVQRSKTQAAIG